MLCSFDKSYPKLDRFQFKIFPDHVAISYKILAEKSLLLPCQWKYWHLAKKKRLRDKTGFGMYNPQNVEKSGFDNPSVCLSVLLSLLPRALTGVRVTRSS